MTMEYQASIFANRKFGIFVVSMTTFLLGLLVFATAYGLALCFAIVAVVAVARLNTRRMSFSSETMRYDGWLRTISVPISDIRRVKPASSYGYPTDRWHAGGYCVDTGESKYWIHPIWFGPSACCDLRDRFLRGQKGFQISRKGADPSEVEEQRDTEQFVDDNPS